MYILKLQMENDFFSKLQNETDISRIFFDKFFNYLDKPSGMIAFDDIKDWIGYKQKRTITEILFNIKYGYISEIDYRMEKIKKDGICKPVNEIYMTIDTVKSICLMAPTEKGQEFRKYYIAMEKLFRTFASTLIQNQLTNPIPQINKYDFDVNMYIGKEILYLLYIKDNIYKFGVTNDIIERFLRHKRQLKYDYVVKCWDCKNRSISTKIENAIKIYARLHEINIIYEKQTEIIKIDDINPLIKMFDNYVKKQIDEHNSQYKNVKLEQRIKLIEKVAELQRNEFKMVEKHCEMMNIVNNNNNITINFGNILSNRVTLDINSLLQIDNFNNINKDDQINQNDQSDNEDTIEMETIKCSDCKKEKTKSYFNINEKTNDIYKTCISCMDMRKIKSECEVNKNQKKEYYENNKDKLNQKDRNYYNENKVGIIKQKQAYRIKRQNKAIDETKACCSKCSKIKENDDFGVNPKTFKQYKQCQICREKDNKLKQDLREIKNIT